MVGDERGVPGEERLQPAAEPGVDDERLVAPEEPVVDKHELRAERDRPLEELARRGHPARDRGHLVRADDLEPLGRELGVPLDLRSALACATISSRGATGRV